MGSAARKLKRAVEKRREFSLVAEGAPTINGRYRAVKFGEIIAAVGALESPYRQLFDGTQLSMEERKAMTPVVGDDPEDFESFVNLGKRMTDAYFVLGVYDLRVDDIDGGGELKVGFQDEDDEDTVTISDLREIYGLEQVQAINDKVYALSNGRPRQTPVPGVHNTKTFQKQLN